MNSDAPPFVKYGHSSGVSTVERALGCPECGDVMNIKTSGAAKMYCSRPCCNEVNANEMSPEQRFYVKIAREESDAGVNPRETVIEWLESGGWR